MKIFTRHEAVTKPGELPSYNYSPYPILSLYLGWDKKPPSTRELISRARSLFESRLRPYEQKVFGSDLKKITSFLRNNFDVRGHQGVAFFTARDHLWRVVPLATKPAEICLLSHSPFLRPLEKQQDKQGRYGILLFDREKAEFILVQSGKIVRFDFFKDGQVPPRFKAKKEWLGRDDKVSRQIKAALRRHFLLIASRFKEFLQTAKVDQLILGGHKESFHEFERLLGKPLASEVVAEVPVDLKKDLDHIVRKCLEGAK